MSDGLRHWNALKRPPAEALKKITGGRLNGMTDIKPQWRLQVMSEHFGPVGIGWDYTIENVWREDVDNEIVACVQVAVSYKDGDEWSRPVPGIGGSKLLTQESKGAFVSDEGYKMALTDALSVALKTIGVAADIYLGQWDGSKYKDSPQAQTESARESLLADAKRYVEKGVLTDEEVAMYRGECKNAKSDSELAAVVTDMRKAIEARQNLDELAEQPEIF